MSQMIRRFTVQVNDQENFIAMPEGAEVIALEQFSAASALDAEVGFWAIVEPTDPETVRVFQVFTTGQTLPSWVNIDPSNPLAEYIGTASRANGGLIWHLFERLPDAI